MYLFIFSHLIKQKCFNEHQGKEMFPSKFSVYDGTKMVTQNYHFMALFSAQEHQALLWRGVGRSMTWLVGSYQSTLRKMHPWAFLAWRLTQMSLQPVSSCCSQVQIDASSINTGKLHVNLNMSKLICFSWRHIGVWGERVNDHQQDLHSDQHRRAAVCDHLWVHQREPRQLADQRRGSDKRNSAIQVRANPTSVFLLTNSWASWVQSSFCLTEQKR